MEKKMRPKFKETVPFFLLDHEVQIGEEEGMAGFISDPEGTVSALVVLLDGSNNLENILSHFQSKFPHVTETEVMQALTVLSEAGYLEDADIRPAKMSNYEEERYKANLNYFSLFTDMNQSKYEIQEKISDSKIALLGVGGLGSQILYHMAALGFHNINALDYDTLDISNFNRQLLYSEADVGQPKIELAKRRIAQFNPNVDFRITNKKIESSQDVLDHIEGAEYVVCVADRPTLRIQDWVNEAVVKAGIPLVSGGVLNTRGRFYAMIPGTSGCVRCHADHLSLENGKQRNTLLEYMESINFERKNAAISPNVAMLAGILVNELLKIATGISQPISVGRMMEFNFLNLSLTEISSWEKKDDCPICGDNKMVMTNKI